MLDLLESTECSAAAIYEALPDDVSSIIRKMMYKDADKYMAKIKSEHNRKMVRVLYAIREIRCNGVYTELHIRMPCVYDRINGELLRDYTGATATDNYELEMENHRNFLEYITGMTDVEREEHENLGMHPGLIAFLASDSESDGEGY
jgi:hypothetical protein